MAQYQAGYFVDGIKNLFYRDKNKDKVLEMLNQLSFFDLQTNTELIRTNNDSLVATFNNMIIRGLPTKPSTFVEDFIATTFSQTKKEIDENNNLTYNFVNEDFKKQIYLSLHIIEPRVDKNYFAKYSSNSKKEKIILLKQFLFETVPHYYGEYLIQLFDFERTLENIFRYNNDFKQDIDILLSDTNYKFLNSQTDFSIELPYLDREHKGIIIQVDENQYIDNTDYKQEELKNQLLKTINWNAATKIKKDDFQNIEPAIELLSYFTFCEYFDNLQKNYKTPLYKTEEGLDILQITLSPLAVARIQKTLLEFIFAQKLDLNAKEWNIAIIEQDIPCAFLAIEDFKQYFSKLFLLEGKNRKLPKINLSIFYTEEFSNAQLNILYQGEKNLISEFNQTQVYDLLIDISVFRRSGFDFEAIKTAALNFAQIRSIKSVKSKRKFITNDLIKYQPVICEKPNKTEADEDLEIDLQDSLLFFFKTIFRKAQFAAGQLEFVNQALQLKNTIASLPFTSGKTVISQFITFLQSGISVIVNPTSAVLKEQFLDLKNLGIDAICYINLSQTKLIEKQFAKAKLKNSEALISFISADMFQIQDFRNVLLEMEKLNNYFAYLIIDEAHSISEWGHDFRESYSCLIKNAQIFCKTRNLPELPILTLSSYCSYDVIFDISNKLKTDIIPIIIKNDFENLNLDLININIENLDEYKDTEKVANALKINKQQQVLQIIEKKQTDEENTLVVCNETNGLTSISTKSGDGIYDKLENLNKNYKIGKFEGTIDDGIWAVSEIKSHNSFEDYKKFKNNELNILIASKTIGIGLNKNNIKNIVHINLPVSIENFIQINNRAGRNSEKANITLLYNNQKVKYSDIEYKADNAGEIHTIDIEKESNVDFEFQLKNIKKIYGNRQKDFLIINELLNKISFATEKPINLLKEKLEFEFDEVFKFTSQPGTNPYQLHISKENDKPVGYIDFKLNKIINLTSKFEKDVAERILFFAKNEIENKISKDENIFDWLEIQIKKESINGLKSRLTQMKIGEIADLNIGFSNDGIDRIAKKIKASIWEEFDDSSLNFIYQNSVDFKEFETNLLKKTNLNLSKFTRDNYMEVKNLFNISRNFNETLRVVHKFYLLNIINDYTIDYNKNEIKIFFTKKEDNDYITALYNYLQLYVSKQNAEAVLKEISNYKADTILERCIIYFNNFWFDNIVGNRINSLYVLQTFIDKYVSQDMSKYFKYLHKYYFDAQYYNILTENSLQIKNNDFASHSYKFIEQFIAEIGIFKSNWKHLSKTTEFLKNEFPDNYILLILNGFTQILIDENNNKFIDKSLTEILNGFALMQLTTNLKSEEIKEKTGWLMEKVYERNPSLKTEIVELVELKSYTSWLQQFNLKFLKDF